MAVLVVAAGFRFYDLRDYPPGLFPDEAANGEDALLILEGDLRPFYPRGNGREGLFFYLLAASIGIFGRGVWPLHAVSAAVGLLTVLAVYFAGRAWFGRLAGLLSAFLLATSYWHVTLSRTAFRAMLAPLFIAAFTALAGYVVREMSRGKTKLSYLYAALAGAAFAGGFYSYIAYRVMIGVALGVFVLLLAAGWRSKAGFSHFKKYGRHMLIGLAAALLVSAPLAAYFVQHPQDFVGRAGQVSIFSEDLQEQFGQGGWWRAAAYSTRVTATSFFAGSGDNNWRHSVAGFPLLNPLVGLLFLLGLAWTLRGTAVAVWRVYQGMEVHLGLIFPYLFLITAGMLLPVITTVQGLPHGLRSSGLIFPVFLLAGTAGAATWRWCKRRLALSWGYGTGAGLAAGVLLAAAVYDGLLYFSVARNDPRAHYAYRGDLTEVSAYLNDYTAGSPEKPRPYLVLDKFSLQTVHFLTGVAAHEHTEGDGTHPDGQLHKWRQVDPEESGRLRPEPGEIIVFTQSTIPDAEEKYGRGDPPPAVEVSFNRFGQEIMRVYGVGDPAVEGARDKPKGGRFDLDAQ